MSLRNLQDNPRTYRENTYRATSACGGLRRCAHQFLQQSDRGGFARWRLKGKEHALCKGHGGAALAVFDVKPGPLLRQQPDHGVESTVRRAMHGGEALRVHCIDVGAKLET